MRAVAALADGAQVAAPPELELYWQCTRFNALPEQGGLLDQDASLMKRMGLLGNIYEATKRVRGLKGEAIHQMDPDDGRLLAWVEAYLKEDTDG